VWSDPDLAADLWREPEPAALITRLTALAAEAGLPLTCGELEAALMADGQYRLQRHRP
jgi:hypothetical protein